MSQKQIQKLPQFKEGLAKDRESPKEYEAIALAEKMKKERREHLKEKYAALLRDYRCEKMNANSNFPFKGVAILKLLARKEEEFSESNQNYLSREQ
jgi:predicted protein tyrosine phosphatase